jgi:hypothetical protein
VDCVQDDWTNSGTCNSSTGKQSQTRTTITAAQNSGTACGIDTQEVDCDVNAVCGWADSGTCSTDGFQTQTRTTITSAINSGTTCGIDDTQEVDCDVDCVGDWSGTWGECSRTCGGGTQTQTWDVSTAAINNGTCDNKGDIKSQSCNDLSCCSTSLVGEWEEKTGYDGCVQDVNGDYKRKYTREGNGALCSESNEKLGAFCSYDCKLESLEMEYKGTISSSTSPSCKGKYNKKDLTSISLRAAKGGTACPEISTLLNVPFQSSDQVNAILEGADFSDVSVPDFKCGAWIRGGGCGNYNMDWDNGICLNGNNCGDGDKFSGQVGWYRKPSFQKNC